MSEPKSKVVAITQSSLFQDTRPDTFELAASLGEFLHIERPVGEKGFLLGTSAFTANGWVGSFYPAVMHSRDYLPHYAAQFPAVEVDSTFYATPAVSTVNNWYLRTPPDFIFAAKIPQVVTHEKMLVGCEAEFEEFVDRMDILDNKLGPLLFQFPKFSKFVMNEDEFLRRLRFFLARVKDLKTVRFVVEIRNKTWLTERLLDVLRDNRVALALTDTSFMPRPWEQKLDLITTDFVYIRWLGDRKAIERETTTWDRTIVDRTEDLQRWVNLVKMVRQRTELLKVFAFANNHYAGHGPDTVKTFWNLYKS